MRALVLSGGGAKGSFQVGVLRSLLNDNPNLDYDVYAGVSVGALNTSLLATGPLKETLPELESLWFDKVKGNSSIWTHHLLKYIILGIMAIVLFLSLAFISFILSWSKIITVLFFLCFLACFYLPYFSLNHTHSLYKTGPLCQLVEKNLDVDKLLKSGKHLIVGAVSFTNGKYRAITQNDPNIKDWIIASSAFPVFFPMVKIGDEYWTDGGVTEITPLSDVIAMGATEIDIILASSGETSIYPDQPGILKQIQRNIDIMSTEILRNDLMARCSQAPGIKIRIFMPEKSLTNNSLNFDPDKIREMYNEGQRIGIKQA